MAQEERSGFRNMDYSAWHRRMSIKRFVGIEKAQVLAMIDTDASLWVEYNDDDKHPVALIETAVDVGQSSKCASVTMNLAKMAGIPCAVVLYKLSDRQNPADSCAKDIESFRVKWLLPKLINKWITYTPEEWAGWLCRMREFGAKVLDSMVA